MITVTVTGVAEVQANLAAAPARVRQALREATLRLAIEAQRRSKDEYLHGPRPERLGVKTGRLSRSVNVEPFEDAYEIGASTGTNVLYGRYWELGFDGVEQVSAHVRHLRGRDVRQVSRNAKGGLSRTKVGSGVAFVQAHSRNVHVAPRPFLSVVLAEMRTRARAELAAAVAGALP